MREDTVLVAIMHVNNEIGSVMPVEKAASVIHERNKNTYFHVDAIQSYGKIPVFPGRIGIDLMSVSGHKLHGPKGSGFLFIREGVNIAPLIYGGGQENGLRSGTENVPAIAGLGAAVADLFKDQDSNIAHLRKLRAMLVEGLEDIDGISINGPEAENAAPHIVSVTARGVRAEVLLHALEEEGVYCSAGSACSSNRPAKSRTLSAIGLKGDALEQTVRFSLSVHTTEEEIKYAIGKMSEIVPRLARFVRR
jgi:cysteine desulfurase